LDKEFGFVDIKIRGFFDIGGENSAAGQFFGL
jgi:hypothetical protein